MIGLLITFIVFLVGVTLFPAALAFAYQALLFLIYRIDYHAQWVVVGFLAYVVVYVLVWVLGGRQSIKFLEVFEHEVIHAVLTKVFFWRVQSIYVSADEGGETMVSGYNDITIMGPYFFPLFTIPLLVAYLFLPEPLYPILGFLIGFTFAFHFLGLLAEFRIHQTDLHMAGLPFALNLTLFFNALFVVLILAVVQQDWSLFTDYIQESLLTAQNFYDTIWEYLKNILFDP